MSKFSHSSRNVLSSRTAERFTGDTLFDIIARAVCDRPEIFRPSECNPGANGRHFAFTIQFAHSAAHLGAKPDLERLNRISGADDPTDSRLRAVVVTDIVGSTRLAEVMGDTAWSRLLAWHDRALVDLINSHRGETIDRPGGGYLATFVDVPAAVSCAVEIQRTLERHRAEHQKHY